MTAQRNFQLTEQQQQELKIAYHKSSNGPLRTKLQAIRLYGSGYPTAEISEITSCSRRTVLRWCRKYRDEGIAGLIDQRQGGNRALLSDEQMEDLCGKLRQYRPIDILGPEKIATASGHYWTVPDLRQALQQWYGLVYQSSSSYAAVFQRCGFSYQRTAKVFRSRSAAAVATFEEQVEKN
jgi:transposase